MVASNRCCESDEHHGLSPRKKRKTLTSQHQYSAACIGDIVHGVSSSAGLEDDRCCPYTSCYPNENEGSHASMEESASSMNCAGGVPQLCTTGGLHSEVVNGYSQPYIQAYPVSGWMYRNERGELCGPYIQEQLYEGLSTGFLPEDIFVFPIVNGALLNEVPLKYFRQFPEHVATGFTYLNTNVTTVSSGEPVINNGSFSEHAVDCASTSVVQHVSQLMPSSFLNYNNNGYGFQTSIGEDINRASSSTSLIPNAPSPCVNTSRSGMESHKYNAEAINLTSSSASTLIQELCWLFEDGQGRKCGPHSLAELYSWHYYGYLQDSLTIYHMNSKFQPFTLLSMINVWRAGRLEIFAPSEIYLDKSSLSDSFISKISDEVSHQLHSGIMKAARRVVLDEIISGILTDFVATKKSQRYFRPDATKESVRTDVLVDKKAGDVAEKNCYIVGDLTSAFSSSDQNLYKESQEYTKCLRLTKQPDKIKFVEDETVVEVVRENDNFVTSDDVINASPLCDPLLADKVLLEETVASGEQDCKISGDTVTDSPQFLDRVSEVSNESTKSVGFANQNVESESLVEKAALICPDNTEAFQENFSTSNDVIATASSSLNQSTPAENSLEHPQITKCVGSYENFVEALSVTRRVCFDYCMQVMWNAVFYEPVSQYSTSWRKRKRWSDCHKLQKSDAIVEQNRQPHKDSGVMEQYELEVSVCEDDFPPGFGPELRTSSIQYQFSSISKAEPCHLGGMSVKQSVLSAPSQVNDNISEVLESVESTLHLSVQSSVYEYFKNFMDEECMKLTGPSVGYEANKDDGRASKSCQSSEHDPVGVSPEVRMEVHGFSAESVPHRDVQTDAQSVAHAYNFSDSQLEGSSSVHAVSAFERLGLPIADVEDSIVSDEPPPPGTEDSSVPSLQSENSKIHLSKSEEYYPKIKEYVSLAMCRQKLHDVVLEEWRSLFSDDALRRCYKTWCASRKQDFF